MTEDELARYFCSRTWRFARADGTAIVPALRLLPRGRFANSPHPNEATWHIENGRLEFLDLTGKVTTRFEKSGEDAPPHWRGAFLNAPEGQVVHTLTEVPMLGSIAKPIGPRVAVLVRTHVVGPKLLELLDSLHGSPLFDPYVLADETRGRLPVPGASVISHTIGMCEELGLHTDFTGVLWKCGDYPIYCAWSQIPRYDYYIQIEFDVHIIRRNPLFIEGVINRLGTSEAAPIDLVIPHFDPASPRWGWTSAAAKFYPAVYRSLFAFVVLSNRAVTFLFEERRAQARQAPAEPNVVHCEAFCGSSLMAAGDYRCINLQTLLPSSITWETFRNPDPSEFLLGTRITNDPRIEMVHPVLDAEAYLERALRRAVSTGSVEAFLAEVDALDPLVAPRELVDRFRRRANCQ